jgi:ABC-type multidrug transport system fused ATPase/permease subunit
VKLIRQLWCILGSRERTEGTILLCGIALSAFFEAVSIGLVFPFIAALKEPSLILDAPIAQPLLSTLHIDQPEVLLIVLGLGLVGAFAIKSGYLLLLTRWQFRYVFEIQVSLIRRLLTAYLNAPYTLHLQRNTAELMRITIQTTQRFATGFLFSLLILLGDLLMAAGLMILLVLISPLATFGAVLILGVATAVIYRSMQRRLAESGSLVERSMSAMMQWTEQAISGIKETLILGRASFFIDRQCYHAQRLADAMRSMMLLSSIPRLIMDTLTVTAMVVIALIIFMQGEDPQSLLPTLGLFAIAAIRLMPAMSRVASGLAQLRFNYSATEVLYGELRSTDNDRSESAHRAPAQKGLPPLPFQRLLLLEHLSYRYPSMPDSAVDDVSLEIPKGDWVGLIGSSGAGKTTLVDLILGLFVPSSGRILVDGRDLQEDVTGWQRNIGYVPQDIYLIDDTVRRNVAFGLPDQDIDDERVWQALRAAQIDNLVRLLPGGLSATTGERGERLSGGERQRLGIARALYHDPQVLVVDEATANLDNATETAIVRTLAALRGEKTIISITHRLAFVRQCDRIYLLSQGRIQKSGTFADVVMKNPELAEFAVDAPEKPPCCFAGRQ